MDLRGKKGLIVGIANEHSIAAGCARVIHQCQGEMIVTYQNERSFPYVDPIAKQCQAATIEPCNVLVDSDIDSLVTWIDKNWGKIDYFIHSIAFASHDELFNPILHSKRTEFNTAIDISCHSLITMTNKLLPVLNDKASIITMSYYGANKVIDHYSIMGPIKAALEASVRYLAVELGQRAIRINAISPGPIATRAAGGLKDFDKLMLQAQTHSALLRLVNIEEVGQLAAFLISDFSQAITGQVMYIDAGYNIRN